MIPERFVTEYPRRCSELMDMLEPHARDADLLGSFAVLVASAAFSIPFARMAEADHPLGAPEDDLAAAVGALGQVQFLAAPFWGNGEQPETFRYARIQTDPENVAGWRNAQGQHPINSNEGVDARTALKAIRNALAHGNIVYLDGNGREVPGNRVEHLAFLTKIWQSDAHRVITFSEEDFLLFLKAWIAWLQTFPPEHALAVAEEAA